MKNMTDVILAEQTLEGFAELPDRAGIYVFQQEGQLFSPTVGEKYSVTWNGTSYECTAQDIEGAAIALGNLYYETLETTDDTGEPFLIAVISAEFAENDTGVTVIYTTDAESSNTIGISSVEDEDTEDTEESTGVSITLYDRTGAAITYDNVETITTDTPDAEKGATFTYGVAVENAEYELDFSNGNQKVTLEKGQLMKEFTMVKPENLLPEYIKKNVEVAGVVGEFAGDEMEKTVELEMADGDQVIEADEDTVLTKVIVKKPETMVSENIKKDVEIGSVVGSFIGDGKEKTVELAMETGDQIIEADADTVLSKVVVKKPETLTPENIVKGANIGGVIGTHTGEFGIYASGGNERTWLEPEHIAGSAFTHNKTFTKESFPNVLDVGGYAFYGASNLTEIDMPLCESVGTYAFAYCSKLKDVNAQNCKSLGSYAFYNCSLLEKVYFPNCVSIGSYAFQACSGIKELSFPAISELSTVATTAFNFAAPSGLIARFDNATGMPSSTVSPIRLLSGYMTELYAPRCAQVLPYGLSGFTKLSKVVFASNPDEVLEIPMAGVAFSTWACHKCSSLEGVYAEIDGALVDMAVKPSGASCFAYCSNLKSIKIAEDLYGNIGSYAFMGCYNLENLGEFAEEKGTRVQNIYPGAFMNCQKITRFSMILGSTSNLSIYQSAFFGCSMLSQLYVSATFSQSTYIKTLGTNAFANTPMSNSSYLGYFGSIYVPSSMVSWFRATTGWSVYSERIVGY